MGGLDASETGDVKIAAIGMQALGSTCMYVVGLLVGVRVLAFVPEVASWLIPGGVASGAGGSFGGAGVAGAAAVGSMAGQSLPFASSVAATYMNGGSQCKGTNLISAITQNTSIGKAYDAGRTRGKSK